jgi:hypothetical protein
MELQVEVPVQQFPTIPIAVLLLFTVYTLNFLLIIVFISYNINCSIVNFVSLRYKPEGRGFDFGWGSLIFCQCT